MEFTIGSQDGQQKDLFATDDSGLLTQEVNINDQYTLISRIGVGGMGSVYLRKTEKKSL